MTDKCPVLILGNKIDIPTAASEQQIKEYFNLNALVTGKNNVSDRRGVIKGKIRKTINVLLGAHLKKIMCIKRTVILCFLKMMCRIV